MLPYRSVLLQNLSTETVRLELVAAKAIIPRAWCEDWKPIIDHTVELVGPEKTSLIKPGQKAIYKLCNGTVEPLKEVSNCYLHILRSGYLPEVGLCVPDVRIALDFTFYQVREGVKIENSKEVMCPYGFASGFAEQKVPCVFKYDTTISLDEEDVTRCCIPHKKQYWQKEYMYFPCPTAAKNKEYVSSYSSYPAKNM